MHIKVGTSNHLCGVISVDTLKGEENAVILLSLVRSNEKNDIGFLEVRGFCHDMYCLG